MEIYSPTHRYEVSLTQEEVNIITDCVALLEAITDAMYKHQCDVCECYDNDREICEGEIDDIKSTLLTLQDIHCIKEG